MIKFFVMRRVGKKTYGDEGESLIDDEWLSKEFSSPIAPFIGMGVVLFEQMDPYEIESIHLTGSGELVCMTEDCIYEIGRDIADDEWESQHAHETAGWTVCQYPLPRQKPRKALTNSDE